MRVIIKKWGNSASVRIPKAIMSAAHLHLDEAVEVREENGRVIIESTHPHRYNLKQLLTAITQENLHDATDFGGPIGRELL